MPLIQVNGREIFYAGRSPGARPTVLLIHGAGGSHLDWPRQLRQFEKLGSCAIDLAGHGRSAKPAWSTVSVYAEDVIGLTKEIGLDTVILVGHSMGGAIALDIALRHEPEVIGLVLIGTGARLKVRQELLELVSRNHANAVERIADFAWGTNVSPDSIGRANQLMLSCAPETLRNDFIACNEFDVMERLEDITIPALVLVGTEDRMTPPKYGRYLADHLPNSEFVAVEGAGHMLAIEQPEVVREAIDEFIKRWQLAK